MVNGGWFTPNFHFEKNRCDFFSFDSETTLGNFDFVLGSKIDLQEHQSFYNL